MVWKLLLRGWVHIGLFLFFFFLTAAFWHVLPTAVSWVTSITLLLFIICLTVCTRPGPRVVTSQSERYTAAQRKDGTSLQRRQYVQNHYLVQEPEFDWDPFDSFTVKQGGGQSWNMIRSLFLLLEGWHMSRLENHYKPKYLLYVLF